jgi:antitoxin component YwqK of YwqJK toxin-antitoxin module
MHYVFTFKLIIAMLWLIVSLGCGASENKSSVLSPNSKTSPMEQQNPVKNNSARSNQEEITKTYYDNGQLKSEGIYRNGKKDGLHKEWTSDGILMLEGVYVNGKANGLMIWYHGEGHMAAKGSMVNDQRHGHWTICGITPNEPCIDANFTYEIRTGIWKVYHENGRVSREQTWKDDAMQFEKCWDEKGKKIDCDKL